MRVAGRLLKKHQPFSAITGKSTYIDDLTSQLFRVLLPLLEVHARTIQLRRINFLLIAGPRPEESRIGLKLVPGNIRRSRAKGLFITFGAIGSPISLRGTAGGTLFSGLLRDPGLKLALSRGSGAGDVGIGLKACIASTQLISRWCVLSPTFAWARFVIL